MFAPKSVAVIGASETVGSVGRALLENLRSFRGSVFPVNSKHSEILGQKAFRLIGDVPEDVDLAVIATPAATVPGIIGECSAAGVKGAVIISGNQRPNTNIHGFSPRSLSHHRTVFSTL
jgi:acetyltransferase